MSTDLLYILGGTIITFLACTVVFYWMAAKRWKYQSLARAIELEGQRDTLEREQQKFSKLLSQKKSSETRLGQIAENLVPILPECPYNPKDMHFLGNPLDFLVFDVDDGKIVFLEVKSGNSRASKKQQTLKRLIQTGRVYYEEMRINTDGIKIKRAKNEG